jgi:hypothetical protein
MKEPAIVDRPKPGERVRLHPASDWFMRGEQYATVVVPRDARPGCIRVEGERSHKRFWLPLDLVLDVWPRSTR